MVLVNPILLIVSVTLLLLCMGYCLLYKPQKPIMTLGLVLILVLFILCTFILNNAMTPNSQNMIVSVQWNRIASFIMSVEKPTAEQYEQAFQKFKMIDIGLFVMVTISMTVEIWRLFLKQDDK